MGDSGRPPSPLTLGAPRGTRATPRPPDALAGPDVIPRRERMPSLVLTLALVAVILASHVHAGPPVASPMRQLEEYSTRIIGVLEDPALQKPDRKLDRREAVRRV